MSRYMGGYGIELKDYKDVWVFVEQRSGVITPVVLELLGEGRRLADEIGVRLCALLLGDNIAGLSGVLAEYGADVVYLAESPLLKNYTTEGYTKVISEAILEHKPEIVLYGATNIGRDLAPWVAARIGTELTADCTKLEIDPDDKKLKQTRPAFGGNLMATIICPDNQSSANVYRTSGSNGESCASEGSDERCRQTTDKTSLLRHSYRYPGNRQKQKRNGFSH